MLMYLTVPTVISFINVTVKPFQNDYINVPDLK